MVHDHGGHRHKHSNGHDHHHSSDGNIGAAFFLNLAFAVIELAGGIFTNSIAIISDAVHDFGDSLSLGLSWYFQRLSGKGGTTKYSYGYKRFSLLGAIINSVVLAVGSIYILSEAIPRMLTPQETNATGMILLAVLGIMINGAAVLRTRKGTSINERVVSLHLLEDVLGWVAVLVGSIIMRITGWSIIDPILSVVIACFVLANVYKSIQQVLPILLQGTPVDIDHGHIAKALEEIQQIQSVHDLHIWSLDEEYVVLTVHGVLKEVLPFADMVRLKCQIRDLLKTKGIQHATIELETPDEACGFVNCI